jgi:mRNA interferase MazF
MKINRGDILWVKFDPSTGSEKDEIRPCVVVSNDVANTFSTLITVVPVTSKKLNKIYPFEVRLQKRRSFDAGKAMADQIRSVDKRRIKSKSHRLDADTMKKIDYALSFHLSLFGEVALSPTS